MRSQKLILTPEMIDTPDPASLGGKGANLARLTGWGLPAPPWFIVPAETFQRHFPDLSPDADADAIRARVASASLDSETDRAIQSLLREKGWEDAYFAVRSSAADEDGSESSFAGQLESFLWVPAQAIAPAVVRVWASAFSDHVMAYRRQKGLGTSGVRVAVVVQRMLAPETSGVAFGIDPVTGNRRAVVVSAVYGLGEGLVSGRFDGDTYTATIDAETLEQTATSDVVAKPEAVVFDEKKGGGITTVEVPPENRNRPCLNTGQVFEIADRIRELGRRCGRPQDVEWAYENGRLYLLQTRPITAIDATPDTADLRRIWDNANIVESYSGVTTPLTFSFVREIYSAVYQHFCRIMGVEERLIRENRAVFEMLGLIKGRIYYNLRNWYNVLALLPGYEINARFMEGMMGVDEPLDIQPALVMPRTNRYFRLLKLVFNMGFRLATLEKAVLGFFALLDDTLSPLEKADFRLDAPQALMDAYRRLERALLGNWQAPLVNDFFAMIFYGTLGKILAAWKVDAAGGLQNDLLAGEGGIISTEPIRSLQEITNRICSDPAAADRVRSRSDEDLVSWFGLDAEKTTSKDQAPEDLARAVQTHLHRFGNRCVNELKLETVSPIQDPRILVRLIREYTALGLFDMDASDEGTRRRQAEAAVMRKIKYHPHRRIVFRFVLAWARRLVRNRENLRFERTRLFGVVRRIFLALGDRLAAEGIIDHPRDVFYLTKEEVFSYIEGTSVTPDLTSMIAIRKRDFEGWKSDHPPDRFDSFGMVYHANAFAPRAASTPTSEEDGDLLKGTGCCPGVIRGIVQKVQDPTRADGLRGKIMVAKRTDPGWASVFPIIRGMIIERGSLLSHSAIVAREMSIPTVVGVKGGFDRLEDGETVELDGTSGIIRRIETEQPNKEGTP